jgi:uncharacterized membrane protein YkvA (DUF1232 family)
VGFIIPKNNSPPLRGGERGEGEVNIFEKWKIQVARLKVETYALYLAIKDPRTPWYAKLFAAGVAGYAFSPIDLIPDFIPVLGYLDDLVLIPLGIILVRKLIPEDVLADCREKSREIIGQGKPTNRIAAGVIIFIWLLLAGLIAYYVVNFFRN